MDIEKIIIEKDKGKKSVCVYTKEEDIPDYILPTEGEYIDAEEDEYAEEIAKLENELFSLERDYMRKKAASGI